MIVLGGVVLAVLIRPRRPGVTRRVAELRAADSEEAVLALATARARVRLAEPFGPTPPRLRLLRATGFAAVGLLLGATAHRIAENAWPPLWLLASAFVALAVLGYLTFATVRRPWVLALIVTGSQVLLNAAFSAAAIWLGGGRSAGGSWAGVFFCSHVGFRPSAAQIAQVRAQLGPGAAALLPAPHSSAPLLLWAAFAHLLAAVLAGLYVAWGEAALAALGKLQRVRQQLDRAKSLLGGRRLVGDDHLVGLGVLGEAEHAVADGVGGAHGGVDEHLLDVLALR